MNNTEWIRKESDQWERDGVITSEQRDQIQMRYPAGKTASPLLIFFAVIGALLIGAGIILIFATNWWKLPIAVKLTLAFIPLLVAQAICLYTFRRKRDSASFREGGAVFLSLSFFAALALIGQVFHTPSNLEAYILVCILFTLPGIYFFRAKAALTIYVVGAIFVSWDWPALLSLILTAITLPLFYLELKGNTYKGTLNYLLFLLSLIISNTIIRTARWGFEALGTAVICGLAALLLDAAFHKIGSVYYFTAAKLLSILCITITMLISAIDFSYSEFISIEALIAAAIILAAYAALRYSTFSGFASTDLFAVAAIILMISARSAGMTATLLTMAIGAFYIVRGSRTLTLNNLNFGMLLVILIIGIRFFDSSLDLLERGIIFILLGAAFLGINLYISKKRREPQK